MAFTAPLVLQPMRAVATAGSGGRSEPIVSYGSAVSAQAYRKGDVLIYNSGELDVAGDSPVATTVVGICAQDQAAKTTTVHGIDVIPFIPAYPGVVFEANIVASATTEIVHAVAQAGVQCKIFLTSGDNSNTVFAISIGDTGTDNVGFTIGPSLDQLRGTEFSSTVTISPRMLFSFTESFWTVNPA